MRPDVEPESAQSAPLAVFPSGAVTLIEAAPDAMLIADRLGRVVLVNAQVEVLFGYARAELVGQSVERLVPERFRAEHAVYLDRYFENPTTRPIGARGQPLFGRRKDGSEFPAEISLSPLKRDDGTYAIACVRDVTERRKAEEAIRVSQELRRAIEEREDIQRALSHDLRSPLSVIRMQAQRLLSRVEEASVREGLLAILTSTTRMESMIRDLVEAARLEGAPLEKRPIDLGSFLRELLTRAADVVDANRIEVEIAEVPPVAADPTALERILTNLVSNALKYSPPNAVVRVRAEPREGEVVVAVIDEGAGIPPGDLPHLFERFWRARPRGRTEGLGLGLFITKQLVTAHGGRIWVDTEPGRGSTFFFSLPIA
jgi:protein-histidine pros-kinase